MTNSGTTMNQNPIMRRAFALSSMIPIIIVSGVLASTGVQAAYVRQLGPTGLSGFPSPTEIAVSKVAKDSPADGLVMSNDVIVGAGGVAFKTDARHEIADAIDQAETEAAKMLRSEYEFKRTAGCRCCEKADDKVNPAINKPDFRDN